MAIPLPHFSHFPLPPRKLSSKATTGLSFAIFVVEILNCLLIIANDKERQRFGLSMGSVGPADVEYTVNLSARYIFYKKRVVGQIIDYAEWRNIDGQITHQSINYYHRSVAYIYLIGRQYWIYRTQTNIF